MIIYYQILTCKNKLPIIFLHFVNPINLLHFELYSTINDENFDLSFELDKIRIKINKEFNLIDHKKSFFAILNCPVNKVNKQYYELSQIIYTRL